MSYKKSNPNGQATMANSEPVVIASDQSAIPTTNATTSVVGNGAAATAQRVTLANDSTGVIATVGAVTAITNALPAGTNAIGKLAANSGVDIGDVDVTSLPALVAGTAVIGKVGIDQTTPGTTNLVALTAETTKVIGTVRNGDGAGNLFTSNSSTYTAKFAQDANLLGTLGTAFSTAGKVDVKGADGDVFVRQATASNLNMTEASAASSLTSLQLLDDAVFTDDTSTHSTGVTKGYGIMAVATPTDTAVNANDIGMVAMTNNREQYVSLRDISGAAAVSGSGNATGALRVELANNGTGTLATVSTVTTVSTLSNTTQLTPGTAATNLGKARDSAIGATDTGVAILGVRRDTPTAETPAAGDYVVPQVSANGEQWVGMAASATNSPAKARDGVAGASDTGIPAFFVRRDTPTAVTPAAGDWEVPQISANGEQWVRMAGELADDSAFTVATTRVLPVGYLADETSTDSVDEGDVGIARMTLDRKTIVSTYAHKDGGWLIATGSIAATKTDIGTANTPGAVGGWFFYNPNASVAYVQFFNAQASAVTLGTTAPVYSIGIPATSGANLMAPIGLKHATAISIAVTTTRAGSTGTGSTVDYNIFYIQ